MAAVDVGARNVPNVAAADDLDDLFNYDVGDGFRNVDTNMDIPSQQVAAVEADGKENISGLGIDEEIKVTKRRAPVPKLDEDRLLGPAGIPKLRRITKERLKFKGKGHEYLDVARLLNVYQLWLDELYPRAKFADGLAIIEKLGRTKRMQTMRQEWINEGKPKELLQTLENVSQKPETKWPDSEPTEDGSTTAVPTNRLERPAAIDDDDEDFYTATSKQAEKEGVSRRTDPATQNLFVSDDEDVRDLPPEDDLDALLGEDQAKSSPRRTVSSLEHPRGHRRDENFDDEMEAMASMDNFW